MHLPGGRPTRRSSLRVENLATAMIAVLCATPPSAADQHDASGLRRRQQHRGAFFAITIGRNDGLGRISGIEVILPRARRWTSHLKRRSWTNLRIVRCFGTAVTKRSRNVEHTPAAHEVHSGI